MMSILLSWQLVVAWIFILARCASSQLSDPLTDPVLLVAGNSPPIKISSIQFEDEHTKSVCVNIYDSQLNFNRKIYYYSAVARLNPKNVVSILHETLGVGFRMWNQNLDDKVAQHLTELLNQKVEINQVTIFPIDRLRLTSKVQSADFSLTNEWVKYQNQEQLRLNLTCPTKEDCNKVKAQIKNNEFENVLGLEIDPPFKAADSFFNDGSSASQEDSSSIQVKELVKRLEETELNFKKELSKAKQELLADLAKEMNAVRNEALANLDETRNKLTQTEDDVTDLTTKLNVVQKELANTKSIVDDLKKKLKEPGYGDTPSSCEDLEEMGHKLNGFFIVKGSKKMNIVFCDFHHYRNKLVGFVEVKTTPVHFYVQRTSKSDKAGYRISYQVAQINEGNAMDLTSGKFTAPRTGTYFFAFTALALLPPNSIDATINVGLYLNKEAPLYNGKQMGKSKLFMTTAVDGAVLSPLTLQSTLHLEKDNEVWVELDSLDQGAVLYESYTVLTGFILEEEIDVSLLNFHVS